MISDGNLSIWLYVFRKISTAKMSVDSFASELIPIAKPAFGLGVCKKGVTEQSENRKGTIVVKCFKMPIGSEDIKVQFIWNL